MWSAVLYVCHVTVASENSKNHRLFNATPLLITHLQKKNMATMLRVTCQECVSMCFFPKSILWYWHTQHTVSCWTAHPLPISQFPRVQLVQPPETWWNMVPGLSLFGLAHLNSEGANLSENLFERATCIRSTSMQLIISANRKDISVVVNTKGYMSKNVTSSFFHS